jgi:uncharacterized protein YjiS (DUF1127 family)
MGASVLQGGNKLLPDRHRPNTGAAHDGGHHQSMEAVMIRNERLSYPIGAAVADAFAAAWGRARGWLAAYVELRSKAAAIRELERLSDHMLRDIGLHRSGIRDAVSTQRMPWS